MFLQIWFLPLSFVFSPSLCLFPSLHLSSYPYSPSLTPSISPSVSLSTPLSHSYTHKHTLICTHTHKLSLLWLSSVCRYAFRQCSLSFSMFCSKSRQRCWDAGRLCSGWSADDGCITLVYSWVACFVTILFWTFVLDWCSTEHSTQCIVKERWWRFHHKCITVAWQYNGI